MSSQIVTELAITNVRLPHPERDQAARLWTVNCQGGRVAEVTEASGDTGLLGREETVVLDANGAVMLPSLCHSHIHLDKCFILDSCEDLTTGDFKEALRLSAAAKAVFPLDLPDLHSRGARVITESVAYGVTSMRAHVEVDTIVGFACLEVALSLKAEFREICDVQIAVFAQEPLFVGPNDSLPGPNFDILKDAISRKGVTVLGSAPYVEHTLEQAKRNIDIIFQLADSHHVDHLDFHLDYNLDPTKEPLIYEVLAHAKKRFGEKSLASTQEGRRQDEVSNRSIAIGHATRLQLFSPAEWQALADQMHDLSITLIGLPQSDLYMMGRQDGTGIAPRGTLHIPGIARRYGIRAAMSVNNVGNAFTPQGSLDPLALCSLGVSIFQSAVPDDIRVLAESVTNTSKRAIGVEHYHEGSSFTTFPILSTGASTNTQKPSSLLPMNMALLPTQGSPADFVVLHGRETLRAAVLDPPVGRTTIRRGVVVSQIGRTGWIGNELIRDSEKYMIPHP